MRILCIDIGNTSITYSEVIDNKPTSLNRFSVSDDLENWFNKLEINQYTDLFNGNIFLQKEIKLVFMIISNL